MARAARVVLTAHPANPPGFRQHVDVSLRQADDGGLALRYAIRGRNLDLHVPTPHAPAPADALWRTTCCELFVAPAGKSAYREFNFSPSGQWAAYDFSGYRERSDSPPDVPPPLIACHRGKDRLHLDVALSRSALPAGESLELALAVILQMQNGGPGHWALAHPPGRPDFHRKAGFVLHLGRNGPPDDLPAIIPRDTGLQ